MRKGLGPDEQGEFMLATSAPSSRPADLSQGALAVLAREVAAEFEGGAEGPARAIEMLQDNLKKYSSSPNVVALLHILLARVVLFALAGASGTGADEGPMWGAVGRHLDESLRAYPTPEACALRLAVHLNHLQRTMQRAFPGKRTLRERRVPKDAQSVVEEARGIRRELLLLKRFVMPLRITNSLRNRYSTEELLNARPREENIQQVLHELHRLPGDLGKLFQPSSTLQGTVKTSKGEVLCWSPELTADPALVKERPGSEEALHQRFYSLEAMEVSIEITSHALSVLDLAKGETYIFTTDPDRMDAPTIYTCNTKMDDRLRLLDINLAFITNPRRTIRDGVTMVDGSNDTYSVMIKGMDDEEQQIGALTFLHRLLESATEGLVVKKKAAGPKPSLFKEATLSLPAKAGPSPAAAPSPQRSIGRQLQETVAKMWDPVPYLGGRKVDFLAKMRERGIVMWSLELERRDKARKRLEKDPALNRTKLPQEAADRCMLDLVAARQRAEALQGLLEKEGSKLSVHMCNTDLKEKYVPISQPSAAQLETWASLPDDRRRSLLEIPVSDALSELEKQLSKQLLPGGPEHQNSAAADSIRDSVESARLYFEELEEARQSSTGRREAEYTCNACGVPCIGLVALAEHFGGAHCRAPGVFYKAKLMSSQFRDEPDVKRWLAETAARLATARRTRAAAAAAGSHTDKAAPPEAPEVSEAGGGRSEPSGSGSAEPSVEPSSSLVSALEQVGVSRPPSSLLRPLTCSRCATNHLLYSSEVCGVYLCSQHYQPGIAGTSSDEMLCATCHLQEQLALIFKKDREIPYSSEFVDSQRRLEDIQGWTRQEWGSQPEYTARLPTLLARAADKAGESPWSRPSEPSSAPGEAAYSMESFKAATAPLFAATDRADAVLKEAREATSQKPGKERMSISERIRVLLGKKLQMFQAVEGVLEPLRAVWSMLGGFAPTLQRACAYDLESHPSFLELGRWLDWLMLHWESLQQEDDALEHRYRALAEISVMLAELKTAGPRSDKTLLEKDVAYLLRAVLLDMDCPVLYLDGHGLKESFLLVEAAAMVARSRPEGEEYNNIGNHLRSLGNQKVGPSPGLLQALDAGTEKDRWRGSDPTPCPEVKDGSLVHYLHENLMLTPDAYFIEFAFAQNNVTGPHLIPAVIASDLASRVARPGPSASSGISKAYHAPLPLLQLGSVAPGDLLKAAAGLEATNGNLAGVLKGLFLTFSTKEGVMPPSKASAVRMFVEALNDGQDDAATAKPLWPLDLGDSDSDDDYEEEWESVGTPESLLALIRERPALQVRWPLIQRILVAVSLQAILGAWASNMESATRTFVEEATPKVKEITQAYGARSYPATVATGRLERAEAELTDWKAQRLVLAKGVSDLMGHLYDIGQLFIEERRRGREADPSRAAVFEEKIKELEGKLGPVETAVPGMRQLQFLAEQIRQAPVRDVAQAFAHYAAACPDHNPQHGLDGYRRAALMRLDAVTEKRAHGKAEALLKEEEARKRKAAARALQMEAAKKASAAAAAPKKGPVLALSDSDDGGGSGAGMVLTASREGARVAASSRSSSSSDSEAESTAPAASSAAAKVPSGPALSFSSDEEEDSDLTASVASADAPKKRRARNRKKGGAGGSGANGRVVPGLDEDPWALKSPAQKPGPATAASSRDSVPIASTSLVAPFEKTAIRRDPGVVVISLDGLWVCSCNTVIRLEKRDSCPKCRLPAPCRRYVTGARGLLSGRSGCKLPDCRFLHPRIELKKELATAASILIASGDGVSASVREAQAALDAVSKGKGAKKTAAAVPSASVSNRTVVPVEATRPAAVAVLLSPLSRSSTPASVVSLRNEEGEYNCFLNVLVQSLWHVRPFREALLALGPVGPQPSVGAGPSDIPEAGVLVALRQIFASLEVRASATEASGAALLAPTDLRDALSARFGEAGLFQEGQMNDAAEALMSILDCLDRAEGERPDSWVRGLFGLRFRHSMLCGTCDRKSLEASWCQLTELVQAYAIRGQSVVDAIRRDREGDRRSCDKDVGGCGAFNNVIYSLVQPLPRLLTVVVSWDTSQAETQEIVATLGGIGTTINLQKLYGLRSLSESEATYSLKAVVCYYGSHYMAFALDGGEGGGPSAPSAPVWTYFDDKVARPTGQWEDVVAHCKKGKLQPVVLIYEASS